MGPIAILSLALAAGALPAEVSQAKKQLGEGDFARAVATAKQGLGQPDVSDEGQVELYRLLGLAWLHLANEEGAEEAFEKVLEARPEDELPKSEPAKVRALYARVKEDLRKRPLKPVMLSFDPPGAVDGGKPFELPAFVQDMPLGANARLYFRRGGAPDFSSSELRRVKGAPRGRLVATVPAFEIPAEAQRYEVEYYLEVDDAAQRRIAGRGDAFAPLRFAVLPIPPAASALAATPWYKHPWVWIAAGVVAAGAGAGIYVAATQKQTGSLPVTIQVNP